MVAHMNVNILYIFLLLVVLVIFYPSLCARFNNRSSVKLVKMQIQSRHKRATMIDIWLIKQCVLVGFTNPVYKLLRERLSKRSGYLISLVVKFIANICNVCIKMSGITKKGLISDKNPIGQESRKDFKKIVVRKKASWYFGGNDVTLWINEFLLLIWFCYTAPLN